MKTYTLNNWIQILIDHAFLNKTHVSENMNMYVQILCNVCEKLVKTKEKLKNKILYKGMNLSVNKFNEFKKITENKQIY